MKIDNDTNENNEYETSLKLKRKTMKESIYERDIDEYENDTLWKKKYYSRFETLSGAASIESSEVSSQNIANSQNIDNTQNIDGTQLAQTPNMDNYDETIENKVENIEFIVNKMLDEVKELGRRLEKLKNKILIIKIELDLIN